MDGNVSQTAEQIEIRAMRLSDAASLAALSAELGYPVALSEMEDRIQRLAVLENHIVYVACLDGGVVGWIDLAIVNHLQSQPYGEIGGLIVSSKYRGCGIGRKLVAQAEAWVFGCGVKTILVRSRIAREAAHRFYLHQQFSHVKTSAVFTKTL